MNKLNKIRHWLQQLFELIFINKIFKYFYLYDKFKNIGLNSFQLKCIKTFYSFCSAFFNFSNNSKDRWFSRLFLMLLKIVSSFLYLYI